MAGCCSVACMWVPLVLCFLALIDSYLLPPDAAKEAENTALVEAREEEGQTVEQEKEKEGEEEEEDDVPDETLLVTPPPAPSVVQVSKSTRGRSKSKCT